MFDSDFGSNRENDIWSGVTNTAAKNVKSPWDSQAINNWILLFPMEGSGKLCIDEELISVDKFDIILLSPGQPHQYISSPIWKLLWIHFQLSPDVLDHMVWNESIPHVRKMTLSPHLFTSSKLLLLEAHNLVVSRQRNWYPLAMKLIEAAILRVDAMVTEQETTLPSWVPQAMDELNDIDKNLPINNIARKFGLSRASFFNGFQKFTGYTPGAYRELRKLRHAEQLLLQGNASITEISFLCGYDNPLYFSLRFKKYYGCSPRNYRIKHSFAKK